MPMMPDANRQWFVYFKDKEMGPFAEADVHSKLKNGELDTSAYVFTEGMSDWSLVSDAPVFTAKGPTVSAESAAQGTGAVANVAPVTKEVLGGNVSSTTVQKTVPAKAEPTQIKAAAPAKAATGDSSKSTKRRRILLYSLLALVIIAAAGQYAMNSINGTGPEPIAPMTPPPTQQAAPEGTATAVETPAAKASIDWNELKAFRKTEDSKGPPFRIAAQTLGETRPVVIGVLSPLLKMESIKIAIYPDNDRNLMSVARIWTFKVPVIDGYFSVGPLHVDGEEMPIGRYHLMLAGNGAYMGEVTFDVGTWPAANKVTEIQGQLQKDRSVLAEKERTSLELKFREVSAAIDQLKLHGQVAAKGPKFNAEWMRLAKPWRTNLLKAIEDQRAVMTGPMFYNAPQSHLYALMIETLRTQESLDVASSGGAKAMAAKKIKSLGQLWSDLNSQQNQVSGEIQILGNTAVGPFKLDANVVKKQLLEGNG